MCAFFKTIILKCALEEILEMKDYNYHYFLNIHNSCRLLSDLVDISPVICRYPTL